jgi:hypothetical protein
MVVVVLLLWLVAVVCQGEVPGTNKSKGVLFRGKGGKQADLD